MFAWLGFFFFFWSHLGVISSFVLRGIISAGMWGTLQYQAQTQASCRQSVCSTHTELSPSVKIF